MLPSRLRTRWFVLVFLLAPLTVWAVEEDETLAITPTAPPAVVEDEVATLSTTPGQLRFDDEVTPAGWPNDLASCVSCERPRQFPTINVTGVFQADAIWFRQDEASRQVLGDVQDVADFRRARLGVIGKVAENVDYFMEFDFGFPGRPSFMDVYVDLADVSRFGRLRIGQWRQPLGMDALTSVKENMFLERALPFALVPFRQIGIGLYDTAVDERVTWAISAYRFPVDFVGSAQGDSGYGMSTRETALLYDVDESTIHVGGGYSYNCPSTGVTQLRSPPEVGFSQLDFSVTDLPIPFFVDTGPIPSNSYQVGNVELAGTHGPWFTQSEAYVARVDPSMGGGGLTFHGAYAQLAYALTGEAHPYNRAGGVYGRITPRNNYGPRGIGAWEVAGRWSYLDLTDGGIDGGVIDDLTLGLNWYVNKYTKFQFNYIHALVERPAGNDTDTDILAVRAQVDF